MSVVSFNPKVPHRFAVVQVGTMVRFAYMAATTRDQGNKLIGYYAKLVSPKGEVADESTFIKPDQIRKLWSRMPSDEDILAELSKDWGEIQ